MRYYFNIISLSLPLFCTYKVDKFFKHPSENLVENCLWNGM